MRWREVNPGIFYPDHSPVQITEADLRWLQDQARSSALGRARLCAHPAPEAGMHEMLICLTRASYVRPHRHFKPESAHIVRGACELVFFDARGRVAEVLALGEAGRGDTFFVRIEQPLYHTYLLKTDFLVFHETTTGPLDRRQTEFAPWAPEEGELAEHFVQQLRNRVAARS